MAARTTQKSPADVTGRKAALLAAEHQEELAERAKEMSILTASAAEEKANMVVDYSQPQVQETEEVEVVEEAVMTMRVNTELSQVTIGHGNEYNFEPDVKYRVPKNVYDHLDERGYVWH